MEYTVDTMPSNRTFWTSFQYRFGACFLGEYLPFCRTINYIILLKRPPKYVTPSVFILQHFSPPECHPPVCYPPSIGTPCMSFCQFISHQFVTPHYVVPVSYSPVGHPVSMSPPTYHLPSMSPPIMSPY